MIQRLIGVTLGAIATYVMLFVVNVTAGEEGPKYALAVIVGAIVAFIWPWIGAWILVRRARSRRDQAINREIDRRLGE